MVLDDRAGYKIHDIKTMGLEDDAVAMKMLRDAAWQVQPLMRRRHWTVPSLREFYPPNSRLLGLNVGGGGGRTTEIRVRLRRASSVTSFLSYESVLCTLLHELVHNVRGPHDSIFYKHLDELKAECEELMVKGVGGSGQGFDAASAGRLGSYSFIPQHNPPVEKLRSSVAKAAEDRAKKQRIMPSGPCKLGGSSSAAAAVPPSLAAATAAMRRAADNAWCPCERLRVAVPRSVGARTTATTTTTTAQPNPASASSMPNGGAAAGSEVLVIDLVEEERIAHSIEADTSGNEGQAAGCATGGDPPKERLLPGLQAGGGAGGGPGPQNRGGGRGLADVMQGRAGPAAAYATAAAAGAASAAAAAGSRAAPQPAHFVMQAPRGRGQGQQQGAAWHGAMAGRDTLISAGHGSGTGRSRASAGPCAPARQGYDTSRHAAAQPGTAAALGVGANNAAVAAAGGGARTAAAGSSAAAACQPGSTAAGPLGRQPHVFTKSKKAQRQMLQQQQKQQQLQLPSVPQPLPLGQCAVQQDVVDLTLDADSEGEEDRGSVGITGAAAAAAAAAAPPPPSLEAATGLVLGQSSSGPVSTSWSCARCTFLNSACSLVCEMCAGPHCSA